MKRIISIVLCMVMMLAFCACDVNPIEATNSTNEVMLVTAVIKVKDYGEIKLELYPDIAPITVANFVTLANEGFYNGRIFHRVINNFMIQGGSSDGLGFEGSEHCIKGEFASNGVENNLNHERGVISMARTMQSADSASSQFFIVHQNSPHLNGDYAAFGRVTEGMEVVDAIAQLATDGNDKPLTDVVIESVTTEGGNHLVPSYID